MKALFGIVILVIVIAILAAQCFTIIPLDRVGVRSNLLGKGVEEFDIPPGLCLVIPLIHRLDIMDPTLQRLDFRGSSSRQEPEISGADGNRRGLENTRDFRQSRRGESLSNATVVDAFKLRTKDQYTTSMDITIYFRIRQGSAWKVLRQIGPDPASFHERFRQQAEGAMRKVMGELYTEDLYNSDRRQEVVAKTLAELNNSLESSHLEAKDILIRWIVFDPNFEQKLLAKQLLEQQKLLARSQTQREMQKQKTEMIQRETEAMVLAIEKEKEREIAVKTAANEAAIAAIKADAAYESQKLIVEAEKSKRQAIAEGEKLRELARAKGQKAINEALQGKGGQLLLSRQMVENLQLGRIEINTNQFNPFDLRHFLRLIGAEE